MIRIGSSCCLLPSMALGKAVETRCFISDYTGWQDVVRHVIQNKQYLIVTICVNLKYNIDGYTDAVWTRHVHDTCKFLKSAGGNKYNSRITIVNEPMKRLTKEQYAHLINLAYPIVKSYGYSMGAGNEEFLTAQAKGNMYQYILTNCTFDILDIHIQGSCDSEAKTKYWTDTARSWTSKPIDCPEAFYSDIRTSRGWNLLNSQLYHAERIGCDNFLNVFNNLDRSAFSEDTSKWDKLAFAINGRVQTLYWYKWADLMESKAPIPNIKERTKDGMIIKTIGHKPTDVKSGYGVELLHELLIYAGYIEDVENMYIYDSETRKAVERFQADLGITVDGRIGRQTWRKFINSVNDATDRKKFQFDLEVVMSPYNLNGDT